MIRDLSVTAINFVGKMGQNFIEIITKLKDGLYDIELENDEVVSSIIRSRQEWSSPEYDALPFRTIFLYSSARQQTPQAGCGNGQ